KVVVRAPDFPGAVARAERALVELRVGGVATNVPLLRALLAHPSIGAYDVTTCFVDEHLGALRAEPRRPALAGATVDRGDPLAVLVHGKTATVPSRSGIADTPVSAGAIVVRAPMQGTIVAVDVSVGDEVPAGRQLVVMEAMKMEHVVAAP